MAARADHVRDLQTLAVEQGAAPWGHWGPLPDRYSSWTSHSNRLIPVYTFGCDLAEFREAGSVYRNVRALTRLYGYLPEGAHNPSAEYFDQTDVYRLQKRCAAVGKKYIILFIFDGMDWQTTWAAAIVRAGKVGYRQGRGEGLHFQDYRGAVTDFGYFVTSPHNDGTIVDVDAQRVIRRGTQLGGYDPRWGGEEPWSAAPDAGYLIGQGAQVEHAYTDSASSATSMTSGIKTYNDAINVDPDGQHVEPIARQLQRLGYRVGVVTSVPISHATPAAAYANNVHRDDYQDLTRDLLGRPSVSHKEQPLQGVDVLLGAGWGEVYSQDRGQGENFVSGNRYLTSEDRHALEAQGVVFVERLSGKVGAEVLDAAAARAAASPPRRLVGMFGVTGGHLPYQTADGRYDPTISVAKGGERFITAAPGETYLQADLRENPTLAAMTTAALRVLSAGGDPFWLMVEAGDVDWANHANNIDNSIGAVLAGDDAFRAITDWMEVGNRWPDAAIILTADHGHYLVLDRPDMLVPRE